MEVNYKAIPVWTEYICDICGQGTLVCTNSESISTDDGRDIVYTHICNHCGAIHEFINIKYPKIDYKTNYEPLEN